jgi:hypothetical protein
MVDSVCALYRRTGLVNLIRSAGKIERIGKVAGERPRVCRQCWQAEVRYSRKAVAGER